MTSIWPTNRLEVVRWRSVLAAVLLCGAFGSAFAADWHEGDSVRAKSTLAVRERPASLSRVVTRLEEGDSMVVVSVRGDWVEVRVPIGVGWVPGRLLVRGHKAAQKSGKEESPGGAGKERAASSTKERSREKTKPKASAKSKPAEATRAASPTSGDRSAESLAEAATEGARQRLQEGRPADSKSQDKPPDSLTPEDTDIPVHEGARGAAKVKASGQGEGAGAGAAPANSKSDAGSPAQAAVQQADREMPGESKPGALAPTGPAGPAGILGALPPPAPTAEANLGGIGGVPVTADSNSQTKDEGDGEGDDHEPTTGLPSRTALLELGLGVASFRSDYITDVQGGNYTVSSRGLVLRVGGTYFRWFDRLFLAVDGAYRLMLAIPGVEARVGTMQPEQANLLRHTLDGGFRLGLHDNARKYIGYLRLGFYWDRTQVGVLPSFPLPSDTLMAGALGAGGRFRFFRRVSLGIKGDYFVPAGLSERGSPTDGIPDSAEGFRMSGEVSIHLSPSTGLRFDYGYLQFSATFTPRTSERLERMETQGSKDITEHLGIISFEYTP